MFEVSSCQLVLPFGEISEEWMHVFTFTQAWQNKHSNYKSSTKAQLSFICGQEYMLSCSSRLLLMHRKSFKKLEQQITCVCHGLGKIEQCLSTAYKAGLESAHPADGKQTGLALTGRSFCIIIISLRRRQHCLKPWFCLISDLKTS